MRGRRYWTTGVVIERVLDGKWSAHLDYYDDGHAGDTFSTEGRLRLRYPVETEQIEQAVDVLVDDAVKLGIEAAPQSRSLRDQGVPTVRAEPEEGEGSSDARALANRLSRSLGWRIKYPNDEAAG
jgi:hypothetical protein